MNHHVTQAYGLRWLASAGASPLSSPSATTPRPSWSAGGTPRRVSDPGNWHRRSAGRETGRVDLTELDADPLRQLSAWLDAARAAGHRCRKR